MYSMVKLDGNGGNGHTPHTGIQPFDGLRAVPVSAISQAQVAG